jgi:serine/threonine-protein kinase HipA
VTSKTATSTSKPARKQLYVWVWLPNALKPVVAGVLTSTDRQVRNEAVLAFTYADSYLKRTAAISLFTEELPLQASTMLPSDPKPGRSPLALHGCLRDGAPDAWGRRVINLRLAGNPETELNELTYLVESGSNRIGAFDFQDSPTHYSPRGESASLEQLMHAAELIEAGASLPTDLEAAAGHGTSIGGATPKALVVDGRHLVDGERQLIAKFSSTTDTRPVIQAEAAATYLASCSGINVARSEIRTVAGKKVLLLERFDRGPSGERLQMVSALTILGLHEMEARHSSYPALADAIRKGPWEDIPATLRELFTRLVFNVCIGNTDDHLRNHAAFWDGQHLRLTPAFDLTPQPRSGQTANQAIALSRSGERQSQLLLCRQVAKEFKLSLKEADQIIDQVISAIKSNWKDAVEHAELSTNEAKGLMGREFLNPYIWYDQP